MKYSLFSIVFISFFATCLSQNNNYSSKKKKTPSYQTFKNDPTGLRLYTLDNGLKVYLSKNTNEPKIETYIAVKAGSNYDPSDNTGLAHYLEHMLFKGSSQIGTSNWLKKNLSLIVLLNSMKFINKKKTA